MNNLTPHLNATMQRLTNSYKSNNKEKILPKHKWGTKQGNWMKVHPLDRM